MTVHLVSFATPQYKYAQKQLGESAMQYGVNILHAFNERDLKKTAFFKTNKHIFNQKKGFGYWLWKPFFILEMMKKAEQSDIIMYADAGNTVLADLKPLFEICLNQNIVLFQVHKRKNKTWTKHDAFELMNCNEEYYREAEQVCGSPQLYKVCPESISFVEKWLNFCQNAHILTDSENINGAANDSEFIDHRHDQSILSLLALKEGIKIHRDPSQYGNEFKKQCLDSPYSQLLDLHRTKKFSLAERILFKIKRILN